MSDLGILDTSTPSCSICHIAMEREEIHYGAVCCLGCRSFFRRNAQKEAIMECKMGGRCLISFIDRKTCTPCRYEKCLRAKMKREFVAPVGEKRKRLRRSYKLKDGCVEPIFQESEDDCQVLSDMKYTKYKEKNEEVWRSSKPLPKAISEQDEVDDILIESKTIGEIEPGEDLTNICLIEKSDTVSKVTETFDNESLIDPYTGELILEEHEQSLRNITYDVKKQDLEVNSHSDTISEKTNNVQQPKHNAGVDTDIGRIEANEDSFSQLPSSSKSSEDFSEDLHKCNSHIMSYIHKKFKKRYDLLPSDQNQLHHLGIENVLVIRKQEAEIEKIEVSIIKRSPPLPKQERKSVIVQRKSVIKPTVAKAIKNEDGAKDDPPAAKNITNESGAKDDQFKFVISLDIHELETIYTLEEKKYLDQVLNIFDEKWNRTSLDEQTLCQTIDYSKSGISENVPMEYFQTLNFNLRDRLLGFLFSLNDMDMLSSDKQFHIMRKNIQNIQILVGVLSYSLNSVDEEVSFMFSRADRAKLGTEMQGKHQMTITQLARWAPIPSELKHMFLTKMLTLSNPFLKDRKIFVMMLMILLFEDKSDPNLKSISCQYWTMLKRYLETRTAWVDINEAMLALKKLKLSIINNQE